MNRSQLLALCCFALADCSSLRNQQLEDVAKDWSYVIRSSQVMPVYPMTEDLFPGDVFLVQMPIDEQQNAWNKKGYLPLDNHIARLVPDGYEAFYKNSFGLKNSGDPPKLWLTPTESSPAWSAAPRAAFPTYGFEAKSGYGLSGALPIQGIPVGISLLGAKDAYGSVTLADARTYGTEIASLVPQVDKWAHDHRDFLADFAPHEKKVNYLRVVNRVYLVGRVAVSIENSESVGAGAKVGLPPPVDLLVPERAADGSGASANTNPSSSSQPSTTPGAQPSSAQPATTPHAQPAASTQPSGATSTDQPATNQTPTPATASDASKSASISPAVAAYNANLTALNNALTSTFTSGNPLQAGATFKFTSASSRSVSLTETFPRPLVIGYLGFDLAIGENGELGPPIPTYSVITYGAVPEVAATSRSQLVANSRMQIAARALKEMAAANDAHAKELVPELDSLGALVPPLLPCNFYDSTGKITRHSGDALRKNPPRYEDVSSFRGGLITTIDNLEKGSKSADFKLEDQPSSATAAAFIEAHLAMCRLELAWLEERLAVDARLLAEVDRYTAPYQGQ